MLSIYLKILFFSGVLIFTCSCGISQNKKVTLPGVLNESSALVHYNDLFISLNDSGNENRLYVFDKEGNLQNTCVIKNAENVDWEALAFDRKKHLYIGDIGNNKNIRKDQKIYKVLIEDVIAKDSTTADIILFNFPDQKEFPPAEENLYYDAEALIYKNDSLFVITKNRSVPFDGIAKVYGFVADQYRPEIVEYPSIKLKASTWMEDSVTDAYFDGDHLYLLTYSKIYTISFKHGESEIISTHTFDFFTQKEGLTKADSYFYITDENEGNLSEGAFLYRIKR